MIISGGVNIFPAEVENPIFAVKGVDDCAVFLAGWNLDEYTVRSALRQAITGYRIPRVIFAIEHIERDASGKI